jgi:hypothetical protein
MVLKYSIDGDPYQAPPYSRAEFEEIQRLCRGTIIRYFRHRPAKSAQDQEQPALPPAGIPPERKQP